MKRAVLAGASGLMGSHLLEQLLASDDYSKVTVLVRRGLGRSHEKLDEQIVDFDRLAELGSEVISHADVYCALGTTIKKAGSQEAFRKVDYEYPVVLATLAKETGAERFLLVSSMGADATSSIFYNRVKGETEAAIRAIGLPMVSFVRPSLLLGQRAEFRLGERFATVASRLLGFAFRGLLFKYRPIEADAVAAAMLRVGQMYTPGVHIYENDQLHRLTTKAH